MAQNMTDDNRYHWIPLKEYAIDRGYKPRTVRSWIKSGHLEAKRDGPMPRGRWLVKVIRADTAQAS